MTVRNGGPGPIEIRNVSITFPWFGWYHGDWDGNATITDIEDNAVAENGTKVLEEIPFTVPAEGRAWVRSSARVEVAYAWGDESTHATEDIYISIETPVTQSPNLTPILYLMGIDTILLILVIIGLAYVSMRKQTPLPPATA